MQVRTNRSSKARSILCRLLWEAKEPHVAVTEIAVQNMDLPRHILHCCKAPLHELHILLQDLYINPCPQLKSLLPLQHVCLELAPLASKVSQRLLELLLSMLQSGLVLIEAPLLLLVLLLPALAQPLV